MVCKASCSCLVRASFNLHGNKVMEHMVSFVEEIEFQRTSADAVTPRLILGFFHLVQSYPI